MTAPAFTAAEKERLLLEGDRTMTARETADRLAEMTGGFDLRRDAIAAALDVAYRRGVEHAAALRALREALAEAEYRPGDHPVVPVRIAAFMDKARAILALSPGDGLPSPPTEQKD